MPSLVHSAYIAGRSDPSSSKMAPSTTSATEEPLDELALKLVGREELLDKTAFDQILEMDDDADRDFSRGIVYGFFDQAEATFVKMENA
ncbi:Phosphorelay intermediate protein, partial [Ophidiomyces ophidiicola]